MLKLLYIVSLFIAVFALDRPKSLASESDIKWSEFENFVNKYSKTYDSEEEIVQRYRTFSQRNILHSSKQRHSLFGGIVADSTAMVEGITRFSDLTKDEFVKKHLTYHLSDEIARDPSNSFTFPKLYFGFTGEDALPEKDVENFDWRKKNVVSSVKDQGTCDNCFVIGSLGNIESAYAIKYGKLYDIDNESFFSCKNQTYECTKGTVTGMFESAKNDGVPLTADCAKENIVKIKKWVILASDEEVMKKYVRKIGPITISFNGEALHTYERGIIEDGCNGEVNHVGLIVGYGVSGGKPFWIVKNSWGADNGENGYFRPPLASPTPVPIPSEDYVDKILDEFETEKKTTDDFHEEFYENHDIGSLESEEKDYPILALPNNHGTELIDELLGGTYDWRVRPTGTNLSLPGSHGPVIVNVNMLIRSISKIDEINMEYSVQMTFREEWMDHRLSFGSPGDNKPEFLILTAGQQIWMPDSFFQNEKIANRHSLDKPNVMIRIHKDGRILYSVRISMVLSCPMHLENYPMDVQECVIDLASYAYTENEIDYQWKDNDPVQLKKGLHSSLPNFQLQNSTTTYCTSKTTTGTYSCLRVVLEFRRQFSYYLFQLYAPTTMLVTVSWFSFWLDKGDIAARVTLGITTLLTMAAQASGINAKLPPVSYTKAIDIWIGACLTFIFAAFLEFAWVTYTNTWGRNKKFSFKKISTHGHNLKTHLIHKPKATVWLDTENSEENIRFLTIPLERSASYELKNIFFVKWMSKVLENQDAAKKADIMSRILFPLAFIMFNLVYWVTYSEK